MKQIDISQIKEYLRCPAQYEFRYVDGIKLPRSAAMLQAHCVRVGAEHNYRQKITSYRDMTIRELQDIVSAEFDREAQYAAWQPGEDQGKVKDETLTLTALYLQYLAPGIQPLFVDSDYALELPGLPGVQLVGRIKLVDENLIIRELKTAGRSPAADEALRNLTLAAHVLAYRQLTGRMEGGVALDYLINTKLPKLVSLMAEITEEDTERLVAVIGGVVKAIEAGNVYPNPSHYLCGKKYCGYWDECHARYPKAG